MGFPEPDVAEVWINREIGISLPAEPVQKGGEFKNKEIPILDSYEVPPGQSFWDKFPRRELPDSASTRVDVEALRKHVDSWNLQEKK